MKTTYFKMLNIGNRFYGVVSKSLYVKVDEDHKKLLKTNLLLPRPGDITLMSGHTTVLIDEEEEILI